VLVCDWGLYFSCVVPAFFAICVVELQCVLDCMCGVCVCILLGYGCVLSVCVVVYCCDIWHVYMCCDICVCVLGQVFVLGRCMSDCECVSMCTCVCLCFICVSSVCGVKVCFMCVCVCVCVSAYKDWQLVTRYIAHFGFMYFYLF